jgi:membrane protein implicated in regulation of membrane protease activity
MLFSIYLIIALVCGILLIVMAILGGDFMDLGMDVDVDAGLHVDAGFGDFASGLSPLSPPILLAFGASFGAFGTIFEALDFNPILTPVLSVILSLITSTFIFFLMVKVFIETQATTRVNYHEQVGREAVVTIPIRPNEQGQIMLVTDARGRTLITAISDESISTDSIVIIEKMVGNTAEVRKK